MSAWKWAGLALLVIVSAMIFASYLRPDMALSFANAMLALCGF